MYGSAETYLDLVVLCTCADGGLPADRPHARIPRASECDNSVNSILMPTRIVIDQPAIEAFCRRWGVTELELFGSAIRDDFRADSDVDVLASFADDCRPTLLTLLQMEAELGHLFGRKVDLLERRSVERSDNYIRRKHILARREPLYLAGPSLPG
jgi:predicted nucleotidyltransferase